MKKNMGKADRAIRLVLAAVIIGLFATDIIGGIWGIILLVLAVVFALTSIVSFCPLYAPFGVKTCKVEES